MTDSGAQRRLREGTGVLVQRDAKTLESDPDLAGQIRLSGQLYVLRGWVIESENCPPHIRLQVLML